MNPVKKICIALSAITLWFALPAVSANAIAIGQSCATTPLGTRVTIRVSGKPVVVVCRRVSGRKRWIRAAVQTPTTTTTSTSSTPSTSTTSTLPEPVINFVDVAYDPKDPELHTLTIEGSIPRTYRLYVPKSYDYQKPTPVLFAFHGLGGNAKYFIDSLQLSLFSHDLNFILVAPNGFGTEVGSQNSWNAGNCCSPATNSEIDDVGFVKAILLSLKQNYNLDQTRIWSLGFSNGGMLSYRLACELADKFTAIGVGGGALVVNKCLPGNSVSIIHLHGNLDQTIPIDGGGIYDIYPVISGFKIVNSLNRCSSMEYSVTSSLNSETTAAICVDGTEAKLINFFEMEHDWSPNWTEEIIRFLFAHPRK